MPRDQRPSAAARGYDARWARRRKRYLHDNPTCIDCAQPATVPDHDPVSRRDLVAMSDPDPDAPHHLKPRCERCHNNRTARVQPGGWAKTPPRQRPAAQHPGMI